MVGLLAVSLAVAVASSAAVQRMAAVSAEIKAHREYTLERDRSWGPQIETSQENQRLLREIKAGLEKQP